MCCLRKNVELGQNPSRTREGKNCEETANRESHRISFVLKCYFPGVDAEYDSDVANLA